VIPPLASVPSTALPPDVREGSAEDKKTYRAALGFEQVMLTELLREVDGLAAPEGTPAAYGGLVPQTLADALVAGGGIGLARELYASIREHGA
jgi:hypothetical protein